MPTLSPNLKELFTAADETLANMELRPSGTTAPNIEEQAQAVCDALANGLLLQKVKDGTMEFPVMCSFRRGFSYSPSRPALLLGQRYADDLAVAELVREAIKNSGALVDNGRQYWLDARVERFELQSGYVGGFVLIVTLCSRPA